MHTIDGSGALRALGFTQLEADIYAYLLSVEHATGYGIAQAISKPAANVYKAITTLENKGAIHVDDDSTKVCSAVPADELLNALERKFQSHKRDAATFLNEIGSATRDDKVYRLSTPEQVFEKCRKLIHQADQIILIDAFPAALKMLKSDIEVAHSRSVRVAIHTYEPSDLDNARLFQNPAGSIILERWDGQWINIVVDGKQFIMAFLANDLSRVYQAVWSGSPYISWIYHSALMAELQLSEIKNLIHSDSQYSELEASIHGMENIFALNIQGYQTLQQRYKKEK